MLTQSVMLPLGRLHMYQHKKKLCCGLPCFMDVNIEFVERFDQVTVSVRLHCR